LIKFLLIIAALYLAVAAAMFAAQRRLLYFPDPEHVTPAAAGLNGIAERIISTPDGERLVAWYGKAAPGQPTLLYFHGNGGGLIDRAERIAAYLALGRGVFMLSYRGYSGSTGSPTESANVADAILAYEALLAEGVLAHDVVVYGESLGSGVAVQLMQERAARGLVLDSPFTSIVERAAELYPWLPVRLVMQDRYESDKVIARVRVPLLIVHGENDTVVPVSMGQRLFKLANQPKQLITLPGAGHNDHAQFGSFQAINAWIDRLP
jgi:uncharacterized protein